MRYKVELYAEDDYPEVVELMKQSKEFNIPQPGYLKDLSIVCRDKKTYKIVGFVTALVPRYADTAYVDYLIIDKQLRSKGLSGNRILKLMYDAIDTSLRVIGIKYWLGHTDDENSNHLYKRKAVTNLGDLTLWRRTIPDEKPV